MKFSQLACLQKQTVTTTELPIMPNANFKKVISLLIVSTIFFAVSCSSPEEKRSKALAKAAQLQASGDDALALETLEKLSQENPDDSFILREIGMVHQALGNDAESAFYLSAAYNLSPDMPGLLLQTYKAQENTGQSNAAYELLQVIAVSDLEKMTSALWFRLGDLHGQDQKTESALNAYLEGVKLIDEEPSTEVALAIGTLFKQSDNLPMASKWLSSAVRKDDPNSLPALFGLLDIHARKQNWEAAEKIITLLDKDFPGALDASELANLRQDIKQWRAAQAEMKAELERIAKAREKEQAEKLAQAKEEKMAQSEALSTQPETVTQKPSSGKDQIVIDIATAEALAHSPAKEAAAPPEISDVQATPAEPEIVYDPNIIIQPAEPVSDTKYDLMEQEVETAVDSSRDNYQSSSDLPEPSTYGAEPSIPLDIEAIIAQARELTSSHNYEQAIQLYWDALGLTNRRADLWNALSKVYLIDGQAKNAATTALEATRLEPDNIQYVLDYLRVVQRVKKPAEFIKELETAYDRFPNSPEVILSLARGYLRAGGNYEARILFERFIQIAPNHPLRSEAEASIARVREISF